MSLNIHHDTANGYLQVTATGTLNEDDYRKFIPEAENLMKEHGSLDLLVILEDFEGWTPRAFWEDLRFDVKHYHDVARLALVGDSQWHQGMTQLFRPFTAAEVRYYDLSELEDAKAWVAESHASSPAGSGPGSGL